MDKKEAKVLLDWYRGVFGLRSVFEYFYPEAKGMNENIKPCYAEINKITIEELNEILEKKYKQALAASNPLRNAGFGDYDKEFPLKKKKFLEFAAKEMNALWKQKEFYEKSEIGFVRFLEWYVKEPKICYYCGVSEEQCRKLIPSRGTRGGTRAQHLEVERKNTEEGENLYKPGNCVLACYVCNNTKSNFISQVEFAPFAKDINEWWNKKREEWNQKHPDKLIKEIVFPEGHWKGLENQSNN